MKDKEYYRQWYQKWLNLFRKLCDKVKRTPRVTMFIEKVKYHIWQIEWRYVCTVWYGDNAENSPLWPKKLK